MINVDYARKYRQQLIRSVETLPSIVAMKSEAKIVTCIVKVRDAVDQVTRTTDQIASAQRHYAALADRKRQERRAYEKRRVGK